MRVEKISIHHFLGIEHLEIKPGTVTKVHGPNGAGKSSTIQAIQNLVKGGHKVEYRTNGSEFAEVGFIIQSGEDRLEITKRTTESGATPVVKLNGATQKSPASIIKNLFDDFSCNPIDFIRGNQEAQVKWLLEAMPFTVTVKDFQEHGIDTVGWKIPEGQSGFETLNGVYKWMYDLRHGANQKAREAKSTADRLKQGLIDGDGSELVAEMNAVSERAAKIKADIADYQDRIDRNLKAAIVEVHAHTDAAVRGLHEQIAALQKKIAECERIRDAEIAELRIKAAEPHKSVAEWTEALQVERSKYAALQERKAAFDRAAGVRQEYDRAAQVAKDSAKEAKQYEEAMKRVTDLKEELLAKLPIKGVEIKDKEIWYRGVRLSTQNTASALVLALKVAALRVKGKIPLICVDGAECLDSETYDAMAEFAESEGLQLIVTRVTDDEELKVVTQ